MRIEDAQIVQSSHSANLPSLCRPTNELCVSLEDFLLQVNLIFGCDVGLILQADRRPSSVICVEVYQLRKHV